MKRLLASTCLAVLCAALGSPAALAATSSQNFNAQVTLTSQCRVKTGTGTTLNFGTYTSFQTAANTAPALNIEFECTRGFSAVPMVAFDASGADKTSSASAATATGAGVVSGLQYTLSVAAGVVTAGTAASTSSIGTPDTYLFAVTGSMPAGQAGSCTSASCDSQTQQRTLTITY